MAVNFQNGLVGVQDNYYPSLQNAMTLKTLQRQQEEGERKLRQERQAEQDQLNLRKVLSMGLTDDQTVQELKMLGLHDAATTYAESIQKRNDALAKQTADQRAEETRQREEVGRVLIGMKQLPEGSPERASIWYKYRSTHPKAQEMPDVPYDNEHIDMFLGQFRSVSDYLKDLDANKPKPITPTGDYAEFKGSFLPGWYESHPEKQKNAASEREAYMEWKRPPQAPSTSFEAQTYEDFLKDPALVKQYGPSRVGFEKWQSDLIKSRQAGGGDDAAVELAGAALDMAARRYLQDGTLPPMGMGVKAAAQRSKILNRAAAIDPQASIAANAAEFSANKSALTQLQKNADAVSAFEATAKKNLTQFVNTAKKVKDSGSPWVNRGLRSVQRNLLGSTDQAAFDSARQVALTEIARVVANPNLTGVLSDSARHEMEQILSGDASLAQILRVSEILLQDMANRKGAIDDQVKTIKDRLKNTNGDTGGAVEELEFGPDGKLRKK